MSIMFRLIGVVLFALQSVIVQAAGFDHSAWDAILKKHVIFLRNGQATAVDYSGFSADRSRLKQYLTGVSSVAQPDFDHWDRHSQLSFLINAYNAFTVDLVLTRFPDLASIKDLGSLLQSPWKKRLFSLLGETRSLDDIEHGLIRGSGRFAEPRIHFALNCASIGCPALRPEAFVAEQLEAQLEDATKAFLADRTRNRLDGETLKVSSIFKWYRADFEKDWRGANSLPGFFVSHREVMGLTDSTVSRLKAGQIAIEFLDYDWRLNSTASRKP